MNYNIYQNCINPRSGFSWPIQVMYVVVGLGQCLKLLSFATAHRWRKQKTNSTSCKFQSYLFSSVKVEMTFLPHPFQQCVKISISLNHFSEDLLPNERK